MLSRNDTYTEQERLLIARKEYDADLAEGKPVEIGDDNAKTIGTVRKIVDNDTGLRMTVVEEPDGNLSVLYQGSKSPGEKGSFVDWVKNDIPMATSLLLNRDLHNTTLGQANIPYGSKQLVSASDELNKVLKDYPKARVTIYAHSLGSMDAQFAMANVKDPSRIRGAYIYNGPNTYYNLNAEQKKTIDSMKNRIQNYIDHKDVIGLAYPTKGSKDAVGNVHHVSSKWADEKVKASYKEAEGQGLFEQIGAYLSTPITWFSDQHVWGGYVFNKDGSIKREFLTDKESRVNAAVGLVQGDLLTYQSHKKLLSAGGYSSHEKIFLDSEQASILAANLKVVTSQGHEKIKGIKEKADKKAEKILASTREVPFGFILSPDEVAEAYAQGGIDRSTTVDEVNDYFQEKVDQSAKLSAAFSKLESNIQNGIQQQLASDQQLAGEIEKWINLK